jgi:PKD repeat protein
MKTRRLLLVWSLWLFPFLLCAQASKFHEKLRIEATPDGGGFKCRLVNPPILSALTKRQPYLSYFWDFGDGNFLRGNHLEPTHSYAKAGTYQIRAMIFTGNTLDLVEQPAPITVTARSGSGKSPNQSDNLAIAGSHYRDEMRPNEDMMMAIGMKGQGGSTGKLYVFFNEKQHKGVKPLEFKGFSNYFGEKEGADNQTVSQIATAKALFNDVKVFDISKTDPSVSTVFLTFRQSANIQNKIKGNKVWTHALWVVNGKVERADLTLNVVPSHDPNDIRADPDLLSFRGITKQAFTYKVRFENTAEGTANSVGVKIFKPEQTDTSRIEWGEFSPKCEECPKDKPLGEIPYRCFRRVNTSKTTEIYFHNAQLAGKVKGMRDKDLNDGFVTYRLYPIKKGIKKIPLKSRAIVTFDGEEMPTNTSKVNFTRGMWWGAKFGMNYDPLSKTSNYFVGATLSPYREVRPYLQFEVMMDVNQLARQEFYVGDSTRVTVDNQVCQDCYRDSVVRVSDNVKQSALNIVPLQVRWDLSKVLSIGAGTSMDIYFRKVTSSTQFVTRDVVNGTCIIEKVTNDIPSNQGNSKNETQFKFALFGDVQVGFDKFKIGARYIYPLTDAQKVDYFQFFAACKF